jgi:hypothetical protein
VALVGVERRSRCCGGREYEREENQLGAEREDRLDDHRLDEVGGDVAIKALCWRSEGIWVSEVARVQIVMQTVVILGVAGKENGTVYDWEAMITPHGWQIRVEGQRGPEMFQGATFNLPLEVAAAVRRAL